MAFIDSLAELLSEPYINHVAGRSCPFDKYFKFNEISFSKNLPKDITDVIDKCVFVTPVKSDISAKFSYIIRANGEGVYVNDICKINYKNLGYDKVTRDYKLVGLIRAIAYKIYNQQLINNNDIFKYRLVRSTNFSNGHIIYLEIVFKASQNQSEPKLRKL